MRALLALALLASFLAACSSSAPDATAADSGPRDTGAGDALAHEDAASLDASPADAAAPDARAADGAILDATISDALPADASVADAEALDGAAGDSGTAPDAGLQNACANLGGICLGAAGACTSSQGRIEAAGASGCVFSDGPGVCCVPPAPNTEGATCALHGGLCAPIAGCNFVDGAFAPPACGGVGVVCCVPHAICGDEVDVCCEPGGQTTFRAACDRGAWVCTIEGTQLMPPSACP